MAGAVVQPPGGGQPVNLKSALKKGSTRRKRQVVIDEARNTYCEATSYFFEDVPLPRRRDLALRKAAATGQQKSADGDTTTTTSAMMEMAPMMEPTGTSDQTGRRGDGTIQKTASDTAPPADAGETTGSETGQKRVPSPQTLVTALLTDSLLALTPAGSRDDNHQFWRPNLPDLVTESVEGDSRGEDSPVKQSELSGSPPAGENRPEETAHTFRVIKEEDVVTDSGNGTAGPAQGSLQRPGAPVATSITANEAPPVPPTEFGSPKSSEVIPERPIPVLITDTETDSDVVDSPVKSTKMNQRSTSNDRIAGAPNSADSFAKSPLGIINTSGGNPGSDSAEPSSPSSDTDLSALSQGDSPDRFWKLSPGTRSLSDFPVSPATSSGSSASSSPPAWDRSPSGSPPRRSPPSVSASRGSLDASRESRDSLGVSRDSSSPGDSPPPPTTPDDGYSLDDIEDALREEPPSPRVAPVPDSSAPSSRPPPPSAQEEQRIGEDRGAQEEQRAQKEQRVSNGGFCPEAELAGFVEDQAARTERLRRRYAAAEDGGFIRRPSVRGVVVQQQSAGPTAQQQQHMYWQRVEQQQQQRQQLMPPSSQHPQIYRQNSVPIQPRPGQMAPQSSVHMRQQSAPMLPRQQESLRQRPAQTFGERPPQQQEQMYAAIRPAEMHPERPMNGQQLRQMAPPQPGRGYQPHPAQMQQQPVQMQPQSAPMHQRSVPMQQQPGPMQQQQQQPVQSRSQDAGLVRSAHIPHMHPHQTSVPSHAQQSFQHQSRNGPHNPASQPAPQLYQQQQNQQYQQQQRQQLQQQQQQEEEYEQQQQAPRPLPMGQTRQQQLEQIRRLQDSHMVRVPAVTVGFPDESSRRQMARWNAPTWLPGEGGGGGGGGRSGGGRERESFRTSRQRSASQQRLEAVGRPASLALPRAYEWPQERSAPPQPPQPPQPPPRFCEPSVAPVAGAGAGAGVVTLPRRYLASPENTGSLPRHQRLDSGASQVSIAGWTGEGPADPRAGGQHRQPHHLPPFQQHHPHQQHQQVYQQQQQFYQQQQRAGWYPQQPAPGPPRWHEQSAAQQTSSVTPRGPGLTSNLPVARPPEGAPRPAEPLYGQRVQLQRYDDGHELSADEHDV